MENLKPIFTLLIMFFLMFSTIFFSEIWIKDLLASLGIIIGGVAAYTEK